MSSGTPVIWMRGGTSKGGYFLANDLPSDRAERDTFLLRIMGSPDPRQIDGLGGGDPLTSKVAVIRKSARPGVDVDYLFLQVFVDRAVVSDTQNCGNILAGVGPFAIERGLVAPREGSTLVSIFLENTQQTAGARISIKSGKVVYSGMTKLDGVPGTAAPIPVGFRDTAGSTCGSLFPTGCIADVIDGKSVTLIDNGMPCVIMRASDFGISGKESPTVLEANSGLIQAVESIRLQAGPLMNLGNVEKQSVPKMTLLSAPEGSGAISTRTFIPHRCHKSIGVFGAVSIVTSCLTPGAMGSDMARVPPGNRKNLDIQHPTGALNIQVNMDGNQIASSAVILTARKLLDGTVFS